MQAEFGDTRYGQTDFVYGTRPNQFFKEKIDKLKPGIIWLPAEGEGRNAVYAAYSGWEVEAFDQSVEGQKKALRLAKNVGISINYTISDCKKTDPEENKYDVCALIYAHTTPELRKMLHEKVVKALKPGGKVILEAFSKNQLSKESGGPKQADMLYSMEELREDFADLNIDFLEELDINLSEGMHHQGTGSLVRLLGTMK